MGGDERERFCIKCQKTVYNIGSLSLDQRMALLRAPKSSLCGRYRIAVRRARPGFQISYMQHLMKYGAGVIATSAVFITLWQLYEENHPETTKRTYRVAAAPVENDDDMPEEYFEENTSIVMGGMMAMPAPSPTEIEALREYPLPIEHVDIRLDALELKQLLASVEFPKVIFLPILPPSHQ